MYNSRRPSSGLQFPLDSPGLMAGASVGLHRFLRAEGSASSSLFGTIHEELEKLTAQEIMEAKAFAASKSHSEAERRRRERINGHLAKLRSMLPNTTKFSIHTFKWKVGTNMHASVLASLLAEVIQHVKELKRQTSEMAEESPLPTEDDELTVDSICDEDGKFIVRASLCCDDRPDLLPDLTSALKTLKLRTLKAEITTVGGRVKNVLVITEEHNGTGYDDQQQLAAAIEDALKAVVEQRPEHDLSSSGGTKRQRTTSLLSAVEHSSI
ncbi:hypothetical protein BHE74_00001138 [Ensete ventricosum]|nr:hypothetical protein BHE74_00001138 [Ensete ventricosum]